VLLGGVVGDGLDVSLDVFHPLARAVLSVAVDLCLSGASLLAELGLSGLSALLVDASGSLTGESGTGLDDVEGLGVVEGVVFLGVVAVDVPLGGSDGRLDLVGVDHAADVGVGDLVVGEGPALLLGARLGVGAEDVVELLEGAFSPDDESTDVASGGELEEVESADVSYLNSGDVPEGLQEGDIGSAVDDQRSTSASVSSVSELALSGADLDGVDDLLDISPGADVLEESDGFLSPFNLLGGVGDDEGEFGDGVNSMSAGLDEGEDGGGSEGGGDGVSFLLDVASSVPSSPNSDGGEHASLAAHVSEGTLSVSGGSGAGDSGNTGDSATGSPGLSGVFHTSMVLHGVTLSSVFADVGVHEVHDIGSDADAEDSGEHNFAAGLFDHIFASIALMVVHMDHLSVNHGEK
jgi:hypothetical protein